MQMQTPSCKLEFTSDLRAIAAYIGDPEVVTNYRLRIQAGSVEVVFPGAAHLWRAPNLPSCDGFCKLALTSWNLVCSGLPEIVIFPPAAPDTICPSRLFPAAQRPHESEADMPAVAPSARAAASYPEVTAGKSQAHTDGTLPANTQCNGVEKPKLAKRGEE